MRRSLLFGLITTALLLLSSIYFTYWFFISRFEESTDNAYVVGTPSTITPLIEGNIEAIYTDTNQQVIKGQLLATLNALDQDLAIQDLQAKLIQMLRDVHQKQLQVQQIKQQVEIAEIEVVRTQAEFERRAVLIQTNSISQEDLEQACANYKQAQSNLKRTHSELIAMQIAAHFPAHNIQQHPQIASAINHLKQAYVKRHRCHILSPMDGFIAKRQAAVGDRVTTQTPLYSVSSLQQVWIEANFKESQLQNLYIGQPVTITTDLYDSSICYLGQIESIGIAAGTVFSLLPAQNATGNWIKVIQRVPVKIAIDPKQLQASPLPLGVSATVTVNTKQRGGVKLLTAFPAEQLETAIESYAENIPWQAIEQSIDALITANPMP